MASSTPYFTPGAAVTVDDKAVLAMLGALAKRTSDTLPAMQSIGAALVSRVRMGFRQGRDPWGKPWRPLKMRKGQPLRDTGRLQASIGYRAKPTEVEIGTNVLYARVHQFGAVIKAKNKPFLVFRNKLTGGLVKVKQVTVPARPFLPIAGGRTALPPSWSQAAARAVHAHIMAFEQAKATVLAAQAGG